MAAAHKNERQREKDALRAEREGGGRGAGSGGRGGGGRAAGGRGSSGGKGGGSGGGSGGKGGNEPSFSSECLKLGSALADANKLPGIIFCMSRNRCVEGAHALASLNLAGGQRPSRRQQPPEEDSEAFAAWQRAEEKRRSAAVATQRALQVSQTSVVVTWSERCGRHTRHAIAVLSCDSGDAPQALATVHAGVG